MPVRYLLIRNKLFLLNVFALLSSLLYAVDFVATQHDWIEITYMMMYLYELMVQQHFFLWYKFGLSRLLVLLRGLVFCCTLKTSYLKLFAGETVPDLGLNIAPAIFSVFFYLPLVLGIKSNFLMVAVSCRLKAGPDGGVLVAVQ